MSKALYQDTLARRLDTLEIQIDKARERLARGAPADKVAAAGDLQILERACADLRGKMARLEAEPETGWEDLKTALEQDFDALFVEIARWIETH